MDPILQGSFGHFPPDQLLTLLTSFQHTGTLELRDGQRYARVTFQQGALVDASGTASSAPDEVLYDLFVWLDGSFAFFTDPAPAADSQPLAIELSAILEEGRRRAAEWRGLLQIFPSVGTILRVVDEPKLDGEINLSGEEFRVLMKIGKGRSILELRDELQRSAAELYPVLHRLETAGLLFRERGPQEVTTLVNVDLVVPKAPVNQTEVFGTVLPPGPRLPVQTAAAEPGAFPLAASLTGADGALFQVRDDVCSIGRDPGNEILLTDNSISTHHARIVRTTGGFVIEDGESRNGTYVNGERITTPRILADDDVIRLGKVVMTFNIAAPPGTQAAAL